MKCALLLMLAAQPGVDTTWKGHFEQCGKYYREGYYRGADESGRMALMVSRQFDATDPRQPQTHIEVARTKWKMGRYQQALKLLDNANALLARSPGTMSALEARSWQVRAEVYCTLGRNEEATTLADKAHKARLRIHGAEHLETLESHDTLDYLNFGDGRDSLARRTRLLGKGHPDTAPSLVLIARIRPYNDVEQHLRQAMRLYQQIDNEHGELAEAWTQLGRHQRIIGNIEEAAQTLVHALGHWRRLDATHPRAAEALAELAMVRGQQGQIAEADKLYQTALERHFSDLGDADLCSHFAHIPSARSVVWPDGGPRLNNLEAYLGEMMRRGGPIIEKTLTMQARALTRKRQAMKGDYTDVPRNLEVLTALRRVQKKNDPVGVLIKGPAEIEAIFPHMPGLGVALVNQDEKRTPVGYMSGGNYRGGRQERWRIEVRDSKGDQVSPQQWYGYGGGLFGYAILKPNEKWHTTLKVNSFVGLLPGDYTLRVQYHDSDEIAGMSWLAGRIVCQSPEIRAHVQPRVIDVTAKEKETIARLLEQLNAKGEIKVLAGSYTQSSHKFIPPDSPAGQVLALGWKAVPQMIDESTNDATPPRQRAWMLALLHSITTHHSPADEEGVLPAYVHASPGWSIHFGSDEAMSSGGAGWGEPHRVENSRIVLSKQLEFARRWEGFRKHIVVRSEK